MISLSKKSLLHEYIKNKYLVFMMIPGLVFFILFKYAPIYGLLIAFKDFRIKLGIMGSPWVGFQNFIDLFAMESFWQVFRNTIVLSFYQLVFHFPAPIIFAILLYEIRNTVFKKAVQTISYLPHFISWVVLGGLFTQFLSPSIGPVNVIIKALGFEPIYFMADLRWFRGVLVTTSIWKDIGWSSIVYLAALSSIDTELYEAANMDGAGRFRKMISITLPSLAPVITIMLIFAIGRIINDNFDQIFNMYNPAVYDVADVISTYTYRKGLIDMQYSFSTAVGLFTNIISFTMIVLANKAAKKINDYGIW